MEGFVFQFPDFEETALQEPGKRWLKAAKNSLGRVKFTRGSLSAWLSENRPELKTAALCAQEDSLGLPSVATYRAAFEAAGIELVEEAFFPGNSDDVAPIVASLLAAKPDILCWDTAYEPFVHALTEAAFQQGFRGQIISCTADDYQGLIRKTSKAFMGRGRDRWAAASRPTSFVA